MAVRIPGINIDEYYQQLGPIEPLIRDDRVTEIMVNGSDHVYVEMGGKVVLTNIKFTDEDQLLNVIQFIVRTVGRRIDERQPLCDARLADGSRVNAVIRPLALNGPLLTVRKFSRDPFQVEDLIRFGSCNEAGFGFLKAAVLAKANIIVSGGTGTGKTTFLNVLSGFIPVEDRIVTIEDAAELQLHQEHVCRLETRPRDINGEGEVTIQRLVINALRMRPERIVVGECRGGEALDMLQAMNTGHDGSMTTIPGPSRDPCPDGGSRPTREGHPAAGRSRHQHHLPAQPPSRRVAQGDGDLRDHGHGARGHHDAGHLPAGAEGRHRRRKGHRGVQAERLATQDPRPNLRAGHPASEGNPDPVPAPGWIQALDQIGSAPASMGRLILGL